MPTAPIPGGVWSATPTPFTPDLHIDQPSVLRLVSHHLAMQVTGIMLGGTCGEGLWLRDADREVLVRTAVGAAGGRVRIALQVTDNSALRVLDNIERAAAWGVDLVMVATPPYSPDATPDRIVKQLREVVAKSPLPIGFYDLGSFATHPVVDELLPELLAEPNLVAVKDSSSSDAHRALHLAARQAKGNLTLLNGNEFDCLRYIRAGYDGLLLGGGIFNARLARALIAAERAGEVREAERLDRSIADLCQRVYGGTAAECWLAGLKELMVQMGLFSNRLEIHGYPLTEKCRLAIHAALSGSDGLGFRPYLLGNS